MKQRISVRPRPQGGDLPPIIKWGRDISAGTEFTAVYKGMRAGKFGPLADLETSKGPFTAPVKTVLLDQLSRVRPGAKVAIKYLGMQTGNNGRSFHGFDVDVFDEADLLPEGTQPTIAPAAGIGNQAIRGSETGGFAPARQAPSGPAARPIRQVPPFLPDPEPVPEPEPEIEEAEAEQEEAPTPKAKKPAAKTAARGRTLKSVFEGLD